MAHALLICLCVCKSTGGEWHTEGSSQGLIYGLSVPSRGSEPRAASALMVKEQLRVNLWLEIQEAFRFVNILLHVSKSYACVHSLVVCWTTQAWSSTCSSVVVPGCCVSVDISLAPVEPASYAFSRASLPNPALWQHQLIVWLKV